MEIIQEQTEVTLLKDSQWSLLDGEVCRVVDFRALGLIKDGKVLALDKTTPYASITLECRKLPKKITGFICNKMDFMHLWLAFKEREIKQDEEVLIIWTKKHYKKLYKLFSAFLPRLWVMLCHKGAFELITDPKVRPELTGEARAKAELPIVDWKPEVMV